MARAKAWVQAEALRRGQCLLAQVEAQVKAQEFLLSALQAQQQVLEFLAQALQGQQVDQALSSGRYLLLDRILLAALSVKNG